MNLFRETTRNIHFNSVSEKKCHSKWIWVMLWIGILCISANTYSQAKLISKVSLKNEFVKVDFDLHSGYYQVFDVKNKWLCIDSAFAHLRR
jgi:hypothetical protein